jgi:hypothetical protein
MERPTHPTTADLAELLFTSPLQASEAPDACQVRTAVEQCLRNWGEDGGACTACVAQEAGDHPDDFVRRMHWALAMIESAYGAQPA